MRVLFDTNVVLDVLLARAPHAAPAVLLFEQVARKHLDGLLCATSITTIFYDAFTAGRLASARKMWAKSAHLITVPNNNRQYYREHGIDGLFAHLGQ